MDPVGFFSCVITGSDWRFLVDQILELERQPITRFENQFAHTGAKILQPPMDGPRRYRAMTMTGVESEAHQYRSRY